MERRHNFQTISWFFDLYNRKLLDLNPVYQRRSVWPQKFKQYFIDTILLGYPAPAIFLYEEITSDGRSQYHVVDGKQRLTSIFSFIQNEFPVNEDSKSTEREKYFADLDERVKRDFFSYTFLVEYLPSTEEPILFDIFDRINRNVAKLTPQELRHARFEGDFIKCSEYLARNMLSILPKNVPRIPTQQLNQMKDVEYVSTLLLLIEEGPKGFSQDEIDTAYADREESWINKDTTVKLFNHTLDNLAEIYLAYDHTNLANSRLRNQADFYSLFGAIMFLIRNNDLPPMDVIKSRLKSFIEKLEDDKVRVDSPVLDSYYQAARSASNDKGPREKRIEIIISVLKGCLDDSPR